MEWFFGPKGLRFSEIGCRPPGVGQWDSYCAGKRVRPLPRMGARGLPRRHRPARRRAATPAASSRCAPTATAGIAGYEGAEAIFHRYGDLVVGSHFPAPGTPTQPVAAGYMANAWMRVRHPDFDELTRILDEIGERVQVHAH